MSKTNIEWTQQTWNPVRGCSRISPGCVNCYAERQAGRFARGGARPEPFHGFVTLHDTAPRSRWTGKVELIPDMLEIPLRRRKPTAYFVNSMSDLFHESLSPEDIYRVFAVMERAHWHTYQILTKRADRLLDITRRIYGPANMGSVLPNVWLGVSVEDRERRDRIDLLRKTPAAVRFLSIEPLLEDIGTLDLRLIDWVIVGGESGPGARPFDIAWARSIVQQCKDAGVRCFVKQLGARAIDKSRCGNPECTHTRVCCGEDLPLRDPKGGDPSEWPEDLRVREMPNLSPSVCSTGEACVSGVEK